MAKTEKADKADKSEEPAETPQEDGEEGQGEEGLNPPKKKLSPKLLIIIGVAVVLLLGGGGAGLYFSGILGGSHPKEGEGGVAAEGAGEGAHGEGSQAVRKTEHGDVPAVEQDEHAAPTFYSLGDILVNLSGDGKRPNFLKIRASLELASEKDVPAIEALKPRIIDHFQVYLRELRIEDLRGSAGLYRLREELLLRVTEAVQPIRVRDVLFQEMLVQ
ncbi:MAG: flagellar basal body-associated FliL family protein [Alphaproteobacteria bacterium]|nr:flagellar basal body-associated FliL family protein [Alphaproteobacteria bacterium]